MLIEIVTGISHPPYLKISAGVRLCTDGERAYDRRKRGVTVGGMVRKCRPNSGALLLASFSARAGDRLNWRSMARTRGGQANKILAAATIASLTLFDIASASARPAGPDLSGWAGSYLGIDAGGRIATSGLSGRQNFDGAIFDAGRNVAPQGIVAGLYAGHNWLMAPNWIGGFEAAISYGNSARGGTFGASYCMRCSTTNITVSVQDNWDATFRGRFGYVVPGTNSMFYVAAGLALLNEKVAATNVLVSSSQRETRLGYTIGGGWEAAMDANWRVRLEYLFADYGRVTYFDTLSVNTQTNTFRFGIAKNFSP